VDEVNALLNVALQTLDSSFEQRLLLIGEVTQDVDGLLSTVGAKLNGNREELNAGLLSNLLAARNARQVDVAGLNKALGALGGLEKLLGKAVASIGHGQSSGASAVLSLDDLITTELDAVDESIVLVIRNGDGRSDLAEERNNGLAGVATDDGDGELLRVALANNLSDEGLGADNVEGGDTEETARVEDSLALQNLGRDGDSRVDGVGNDQDEGLGGDLSSDLDQALDDAGVDVEQVVTGHARLAGNTGGDDDDVGILEGSLGALVGGQEAAHFRVGRDVRQIGRDTGGVDDIVERELVNEGRELQEQREGLANATSSTSNDGLDHFA